MFSISFDLLAQVLDFDSYDGLLENCARAWHIYAYSSTGLVLIAGIECFAFSVDVIVLDLVA